MAGISKVTIIGNLGRDPETRYTPNGTMNVSFTVAVNRRFRDQGGQEQERTNWFRVTAWGKLAEIMDGMTQNGYLTKGKQIYVEGRLEAREYQDPQGQTRTSLDVTANEIQLLGSRADSEGGGGGGRPSGPPASGGGSQGGSGSGSDDGGSWDDVPF